MTDITHRLAEVQARIEAAARRAGREVWEIELVAVSKLVPAEQMRMVYDAGLRHFGENRAQELRDKHPLLPRLPVAFHRRLAGQQDKISGGAGGPHPFGGQPGPT